jgi:3-hydroxymyristoyl/3-hydroxydecanoyl-(acyl carrier protein) dehydratase
MACAVNCAPIVRAFSVKDNQVILDLDLPAELPCFKGHFPDFPVLAGVVQVDWVMQLAAAHLGCGQPAATDFAIKFRRVILPGHPLTLTLSHDVVRHRLDFIYRTGDHVASQGRVMLPTP